MDCLNTARGCNPLPQWTASIRQEGATLCLNSRKLTQTPNYRHVIQQKGSTLFAKR